MRLQRSGVRRGFLIALGFFVSVGIVAAQVVVTGGGGTFTGGNLSSAITWGSPADIGLDRASAGVVKVTNGGAGTGTLQVPVINTASGTLTLSPATSLVISPSQAVAYFDGPNGYFNIRGDVGRIGFSPGADPTVADDSYFSRLAVGVVGVASWVQQTGGYLALNADYTNATASFTNTNLSATVISGRTYMVEATVFLVDSTAADGAKIDFNGGTAAATNFRMHCILDDTTTTIDQSVQITALATALSQASLTGASLWKCHGSFVPSGNGTFILRGGQVAHTTGTLTINRGSYLRVDDAKPL